MSQSFNSYINHIELDFWKTLCEKEGKTRLYHKGEKFAVAGQVCRYIGYVKSGILKYVAYTCKGEERVTGFEFAGEFVADFPGSLYDRESLVSIVAMDDCEIACIEVERVKERMAVDNHFRDIVMHSTEALFTTVYSRFLELHTLTAAERYNRLISHHRDIFELFPLKDIASYLNVTPTHLSRLRHNL